MADLDTATTDELVNELMRRNPAGAVLLFRPDKDEDDELYFSPWGTAWLVLGMLDHAHELQQQFTTGLSKYAKSEPDA